MFGIGCPSKTEPDFLRFDNFSFIHPDLCNVAYRIGAAWPLLSMNSSLFVKLGFVESYFITSKKRTDINSAQDKQEVGCPLPAAVVISRTSRLRIEAIFSRSSLFVILPFLLM